MSTAIHPTAVIAKGAELGARVRIGPYCVIGAKVQLGDEVCLESHVVIGGDTQLGAGCHVFPFASLGSPPQDMKYQGEATQLVIGKQNRFGQTATVETGTAGGGGVTRIGDHGLYMIGCHIGHDSQLGHHVIMANHVALAGHVQVEDYAYIGGLSAVHQFCRIGTHAMLGGASGLKHDVIPYGIAAGNPASLQGLNLIGLRRRGLAAGVLRNLRQAYQEVFCGRDSLEQRVRAAQTRWTQSAEVMTMLRFMHDTDKQRGLCLPDPL